MDRLEEIHSKYTVHMYKLGDKDKKLIEEEFLNNIEICIDEFIETYKTR